ncbi:hypothetical protein [Streptomyces sp. NPDC088725]|uniref:hypothetical protein n=1 Tax=Streptomyces sp. NPDC088725 TaxID=3365873 RepID=UPI003812069B
MKQFGAMAVVVLVVAWAVWNLWNVYRVAIGLRSGSWRRPMWWTRLCSVSLFAALIAWIRGLFSQGLDAAETCRFVHHVPYDDGYRGAHAEEFGQIFPLHSNCNAQYDMVPAWVNPAIVSGLIISLLAVGVLLGYGVGHLNSLFRRENQA